MKHVFFYITLCTLFVVKTQASNSIVSFKKTNISESSNDTIKKAYKKTLSYSKNINASHKTTSSFLGEWGWEKADESTNFGLTMKKNGSNLTGTYCYSTMDNGGGVTGDCHENDDNVSFTIPYPSGNSFTTPFTSSISKSTGVVKIYFDGKFLIWEVIKAPSGKYLCPLKARLIKGKLE